MAIINRLRFVDILSPHLGDEPAREMTDALQDEFTPLVSSEALDLVRAEMRVMAARIEAQIWRAAAVVAGLQLTATGIAVGLILGLD
ncbi:MAG: hypothetical protein OXH38_12270 [Chloroflexi bacterium]|nr:hypothetical protein [Chloroflexota bacterium]